MPIVAPVNVGQTNWPDVVIKLDLETEKFIRYRESISIFIHLSVYFEECNVVVESSLDKVGSDEHFVDCSDLLESLLLPPVMIPNNELYVASVDPKQMFLV